MGRPTSAARARGSPEVPPLVASILSSPGLEAPEGSDMLQMLKVTEAYWKALKNQKDEPDKPGPTVVKRVPGESLGEEPEFDVCVCGGTLGVLVALALQKRGHRVCIVEKRKLAGRNQEWNIGREAIERLVSGGLLTHSELEACIVSEFNPVRVGLHGMREDIWVEDVLNLGVQPRLLLEKLRNKFLEQGGTLLEHTAFRSADVFEDGVRMRLLRGKEAGDLPLTPGDTNRPNAYSTAAAGSGRQPSLTCRLILDCMGHYGPITKQIRGGAKPKGMVVVVGGCMSGVPPEKNTSADLLYTTRDSEDDLQLFWEAFPAAGGNRTAYMFAYSDAEPGRPSFSALLDKFFKQVPEYQGVPLSQLQFKRVLFGAFPCYPSNSPLPPAFDRVLQIGDAAAGQSPLSFGGFGAMVHHLDRLTEGVDDALRADLLSKSDLGWLQPYQPSLSVAWLFQRAMSVNVGQLKRQQGKAGSAQQPEHEKRQLPQEAAAPELVRAGSMSNAILPAPRLRQEVVVAAVEERQRVLVGAAASAAIAAPPAPSRTSGSGGRGWYSGDEPASLARGGQGSRYEQDGGFQQPSYDGYSPAGSGHRSSSSSMELATQGMSAGGNSQGWLEPGHVNRMMRANMEVMRWLGDGVLRPFLSDNLRFVPLALTMGGMSVKDPIAIVTVVRHLGPRVLVDWTGHFLMLGVYTLFHVLLSPLRPLIHKSWAQAPAISGGQPQASLPGGGDDGSMSSTERQDGKVVVPAKGSSKSVKEGDAGQARWQFVALRVLDALAAGSGMM
ncbi:hypothetical protein N2152v2_002087 [Parachlorella kessleri]